MIGARTLEVAAEAGLAVLAVEAGRTLLLEPDAIAELARRHRISVVGWQTDDNADPGINLAR